MALGALKNISVWDRPANVVGAVGYGYADAWLDAQWSEALDGSDSCEIVTAFESRFAGMLRTRRVVALHGAPATPTSAGELRYYRIHQVVSQRGPDGVRLIARGRSLFADWTDAGPISQVLSGGRHEFTIAGSLTPVQWLTNIALPHLQRMGYGWYTAGVSSGPSISLVLERQTAAQLAESIRAFLGFELLLDQSTWAVAFVSGINAGLDPLLVSAGSNLTRLQMTRGAVEQATIVVPSAGRGHSEITRGIQRHVFEATNIDFGLKTLECLAIDKTSVYPIVQFDGQFFDPSGARVWYLQRTRTGRCFRIMGSVGLGGVAQLGKFTLDDLTDLGTASINNQFELREGLTPGTPIDVPGRPYRVSGAPAGNIITLDDPISSGDPVPTNDVRIDCRARFSPQVLSTTCSNIADVVGSTTDQDLTLPATSAVQVGDWGFLHDNVAVPWSLFGKVFTVVGIQSTTVIRVRVRYSFDTGKPFGAGAVAKQLKFHRARPSVPYVNDEVAATNQLTLTSATGVTSQDLVEFALDNSGAVLTGVPAPSLLTDGVVRKDASFPDQRCLVNLLLNGNPYFDVWPGATPTNWTGSLITKLTTNLPGPGTLNAVRLTNGGLTSPVFYVRPTAGDSKLSVRVRLRTGASGNWSGANSDQAQVNILVPGAGPLLFGVIHAPGHPTPSPGSKEVAANTVVDFDVLAAELLHTPGIAGKYAPWDGLQISISCTGIVACQVDVGGVMVLHDTTLPEAGYMTDRAEQYVFGLANQTLAAIADPETSIDLDAIDLGAILKKDFPARDLILGRRVQVVDEVLGIAAEERIAVTRFRASPTGAVDVDVRTKDRRLVDVLAKQLAAVTTNG